MMWRDVARWAARIGLWLVSVALLLLFGAATVVPAVAGGSTYVVTTASMEPTIHPGDVVVSSRPDMAAVRSGDVVTYRTDHGALVTHRVVRVDQGESGPQVVCRGDANRANDPPFGADRLVGKIAYRIPYLGLVTGFLQHHQVALISGLVVIVVAWTVWAHRRATEPEPTNR